MLNQPKAVIYVPAGIFETNTFAVRQILQDILGNAIPWQNSELPLLVIA
jgi:hypothetical protein